ncbi:aldehyde oxidase [Lynx pardinus]|uniref:Aldehyde oxidase n=1 Tax=Lynx pardinus TaxID=191816 RepID=A0A485PXC7_LYNPA|nr:aldehyde oxidase [Lynx pardinus]
MVPNPIFTVTSMGIDINGKAVQIAKALEESINLLTTGYFKGYHTDMDWEKEEGDAYPHSVYGASCSEVEADCLTGAHKLLRTDIDMDAAFSMNPALGIGQIEREFIQAMRSYTIEELKYFPEGVLYSQSPDDYKIPTVTDIPEELCVTLVHFRNPTVI